MEFKRGKENARAEYEFYGIWAVWNLHPIAQYNPSLACSSNINEMKKVLYLQIICC